MTVGERIQTKRKQQRLTLGKLAESCNLSISFLSDIEHGRRKPALDKLWKIAQSLNTTVSYLLGEESEVKEKRESYHLERKENKSLEFREVLRQMEGFDQWSDEDREELLTYLKIKGKIRNSISEPKKS
ncbi:MAG: HTH-type transcriptional regulator DdrOC [Candidatus Dichloromethanomonas elyunquensis]|nr:MAG: HTH-type transcriptional regulator DdrOC [Candidatus Dichloromethanomonas elyunquensis]